MIDISDTCQHPGCHERVAIWIGGISACADHEKWLEQTILNRLRIREEEEKKRRHADEQGSDDR